MLSQLEKLRTAVQDFVHDDEAVEPMELRSLIDQLEGKLVSSQTVLHLPARRGGRAAKRLGWGRGQA